METLPQASEKDASGTAPSRRPVRLLLVENNPLELDAYEELASSGTLKGVFEIHKARTADEAKRLYHEDPCPMVGLFDGHLDGDSTGVDLCVYLRQQKTFMMIGLLSGDKDLVRDAARHGANWSNLKPVDPVALQSQLKISADAVEEHIRLLHERHYLSKEVRSLLHDPLTGFMVRSFFEKRMEGELSRAWHEQKPLSVLFLDLDGFKETNDRYGHPAGDGVLKIAAECIKGCMRPYDLLGRYGGDEFVIGLPNTGDVEAYSIAERICEALTIASATYDGSDARVTPAMLENLDASIGQMTLYKVEQSDDYAAVVEHLIRQADILMYKHKKDKKDKKRHKAERAEKIGYRKKRLLRRR